MKKLSQTFGFVRLCGGCLSSERMIEYRSHGLYDVTTKQKQRSLEREETD